MDFCFDSFHSSRGAQKRHTHITSVAPLGQLTSQYTLQKFAFGEEGEKRNQRCTAVTSSGRTRSPWPPERPSAGPGSRADLERSDHRDGSSGDAQPLPAAPSQPASRFTRGSLQLATRIPLPPQTSVSVGRTEACVCPPPPPQITGQAPGWPFPGSRPRFPPAEPCRGLPQPRIRPVARLFPSSAVRRGIASGTGDVRKQKGSLRPPPAAFRAARRDRCRRPEPEPREGGGVGCRGSPLSGVYRLGHGSSHRASPLPTQPKPRQGSRCCKTSARAGMPGAGTASPVWEGSAPERSPQA